MPHIDYPPSRLNASIACRGFQGTISMTLSPTQLPAVAPVVVIPPVISPVTAGAVSSVAGVIGAAAAASSALVDAQSLVALGRPVCAPQALHEATSASQFLLSPFYSLGDYAMVFGNLGLFLLFHAVHRLMLHRARKIDVRTTPPLFPSSHGDSKHRLPRAEAAVKFLNLSITVAMLLLPGVVSGGTRGLFSGEVVETIGGVVAAVVTAFGVRWRVLIGRSREVQRFKFIIWPHHARQSFAVPWLLPCGQWGPLSLRSTHGRLRGAIRLGCEWLSAQTIGVGMLVQAVASIPVPTSWCVGLWFVLCGIQLVSVVVTAVVRPARAPATDVLQIVSLLIIISVEALAGLFAAHSVSDNDIGATTMLVALSVCAMAVSIVKAGHTMFILLWERRNQNEMNAQNVEALTTTTSTAALLTSQNENAASFELVNELRDVPAIFLFEDAGILWEDRRRRDHQSRMLALARLIETICSLEIESSK